MNNELKIGLEIGMTSKLKAYGQLMKTRLSLLVVFSGAIAFLLGSGGSFEYQQLIVFGIGGFLVTASANIINQVIERDLDKLMVRTQNRPLPNKVLTVKESIVFSVLLGVTGLVIHLQINFLTFGFSLLSLILYGFVYTPLKRVGPIAVLVGAFPGAFPPLIGWVAARGQVDAMAVILFGIQFLWQFPHFWAIAWVAHEDYTKAGFKLLPSSGGRNLNTAFTIMTYTLFLVPASILPYMVGFTGVKSAIVVMITGMLFLAQTFLLMKNCDKKSAKQMMFGSFLYLPIVQIAYVLDTI